MAACPSVPSLTPFAAAAATDYARVDTLDTLGQVADGALPHCYAWVTTGTPPTHSLFNASICAAASPFRLLLRSLALAQARGGGAPAEGGGEQLLAAPPVVVAAAGRGSDGRARRALDALFLVSDGTLTSVSASGRVNWQVRGGSRAGAKRRGKAWHGVAG